MALPNDGVQKIPPSQENLVLGTIINNIPAMVFYKNLEGEYIAANEMFCRQLKTTPAEIIGRTDFDFYDASVAQRYKNSDLELIETGSPLDGFEDEIMVDGEARIYTSTKVLTRDGEGNPSGIIGLSYDITDNHHAEQELIESRTRYKYMYNVFRLMADNIPDLLWAKDLRKHYLFANKAVCESILGAVDTEEPIGKTDRFFAERERRSHPGEPDWHTFGEICDASDDLTMRQKSPGRFDEYGKVRGEYIFLDVQKAPIMDDDGNMIGTVGSGRDITMQKLMEQEFHSLYQRNRAIIAALPDVMFLFDDDGTFLETYASNFTELPALPEELAGKHLGDFFEPLIAGRMTEAISRCLLTETIQTLDYKLLRDTGTQYYEARLIKAEEKRVLCISRNITVQTLLQQELVEAKEKAEESSRLKSTLLNNMSHEIRTPLNGILGFSDIMIKELRDEDYVEMATYINKSGKRLMKTLDSIMQLSQLESGIKSLHKDIIDVETDLGTIITGFREIANEKGLSLEIRNIPSCRGYADSFFFTQVISNILENAIKFTQKGGVAIDAYETSRGGIRILQVNIEDTGIGISETHRKIIFDEFRQVSEGRNRNFEGTGLGLTIAIKMVQLLGGDILVESEMGKGSMFRISIPFPEPELTPANNTTPVISGNRVIQNGGNHQNHRSVMVVDDQEENAQQVSHYIQDYGRTDWARDSTIAIAMIKQKKFDAILININPDKGMSGIQGTHLIRTLQAYQNIPVIAITGLLRPGEREQFLKAGYADCLVKPVEKAALLDLLHRITSGLPSDN
ncbi:MAG: PAS domain-containing protein [Bacteroidota bacterium]